MSLIKQPFGFGVGGAYQANSVRFDGSSDCFQWKTTSMTINNGKAGTISVWLDPMGNDGAVREIIRSVGEWFEAQFNTDNKFRVRAWNGSAYAFNMYSTDTYIATDGWTHFLATWNLATGTNYMYVDSVDVLDGGSATSDFTIDYQTTGWTNFAHNGSGGVGMWIYDGEVADLWFDDSYMDITDSANRLKFIDGDGKPVDLGDDGSKPTGSSPILYQSKREGEDADDFGTNKGTGGDITLQSSIADGSSSPSD
jgi:hypothetical protein